MRVVIAEKPSAAADIANVLGITKKEDGFFSDGRTAITWAFGHLVQLAPPADYGFESWSTENLPMLPDPFRLVVRYNVKPGGKKETDKGIEKQLGIIKALFDVAKEIIVATDAGREGELIFRYIYEYIGSNVPFKRLWISSLTDEAIKKGFENLKEGYEFDRLYLSAKCRAESDWLVGMNATQALSIAAAKSGGVLSLGRVQTPTLAMVCKRFIEKENFKTKFFYRIKLNMTNAKGAFSAVSEPIEKEADAKALAQRILNVGTAKCAEIGYEPKQEAPPLLYDLTLLQQEANRIFGHSADLTLKTAQALYEKKLITYPRTGSRYISEDVFAEIPDLINFAGNLPESNIYSFVPELVENLKNNIANTRCVNAEKVTDHHAILPTGKVPTEMSKTAQEIYDLIVSRMLEAFMPNCKKNIWNGTFSASDTDFFAKYTETVSQGWRAVRKIKEEEESDASENFENALTACEINAFYKVLSSESHKGKTVPKPLHTEASLLQAMERCSNDIEDEVLAQALKGSGLGTPATRAAIIEILFNRDYCERKGKSIAPTKKGLAVYELVKDMRISQAVLTGEWEHRLEGVCAGEIDNKEFMDGIRSYASEITREILDNTNIPLSDFSKGGDAACPKCGKHNVKFYEKVVKCPEETCGFVVFRNMAGKMLTDSNIIEMLTKGKTKEIKGFKSKAGKDFSASVKLDENFKTTFEFNNAKK